MGKPKGYRNIEDFTIDILISLGGVPPVKAREQAIIIRVDVKEKLKYFIGDKEATKKNEADYRYWQGVNTERQRVNMIIGGL